ncbi:TPA: DUF4111 domain-containing protein [Candidatus Poribacteria bacterium]|nr:DUF4111 domain-containing protein [Candidatus Poribacteria bacterium]
MYGWESCPEAVRGQIEEFLTALREILKDNLVGLYLHGSLAMGCFNPKLSDLDLLAVTKRRMSLEEKREIIQLLLRSSGSPSPIEISFLSHADLNPWRYPTPFDLHYSEEWRDQYIEQLQSGEWRSWNEERLEDEDLAAHITIAINSGIPLHGPSPERVFPGIPEEDYVASILSDFQWACDRMREKPVYGVLNSCRVYLYLLEGKISSKEEAGDWAIVNLPCEFRGIPLQALGIYRGDHNKAQFDDHLLDRFVLYMRRRISELMSTSRKVPLKGRCDI